MLWLVILGLLMGWIDSPRRGLSDGAEGVPVPPIKSAMRGDGTLETEASSAPPLSPLPDIPEMYLRPELIPIKEPDDTPKIADRFVRSRH